MGINVTHVKDILLADGVNKVFPFTFPVMDKADVKCLYVLPSGEETDLLAAEYEVRLTDTGGEVTYPLTGDALAEGCKLVIYRETPRTTDYNPQNTTTFDAETISKEIERLTMENQEQDEKLARSVSLSIGSEANPDDYLDEINGLLVNARELQESAITTCTETLLITDENKNIAVESASTAVNSAAAAAATVNGFDAHAAGKQADFDNNAVAKTASFNANAADKTTAFNNNAASKQVEVNASASAAAASAQEAANSAVAARPLSDKNITNCITAIPQDIKLALVDGVLTLKAGSKVYKANGESITISGDLVTQQGGTNIGAFVLYRSDNNTVYTLTAANMFSGTTAPANPVTTTTWLDLGLKEVKIWDGSQWIGGVSLPLCRFNNQDGKVTAVTQVFNGMGYIGNSVYALPGVKGLIPNGFNADGSLNSVEFKVSNVLITTNGGSTDERNIVLNALWMGHPRQSYYNVGDNRNYRMNDAETGIQLTNSIIAAEVEYVSGRVTSLKPKTVYHAVDYADIQNRKLIAYEGQRDVLSSDYIRIALADDDEIIYVPVSQNCTIAIDDSSLNYSKKWFTVQLRLNFTNGAKTVTFAGKNTVWINGNIPNFADGRMHWIVIRLAKGDGTMYVSDGGSEG